MTPKKSRATAVLLSLVVPGIGHVYLGVIARAALFLLLNPLLALAIGLAAPEATTTVMIATLSVCLVLVRLAAAGDTLLVPREHHRAHGTGVVVGLVIGGLVLAQVTAMVLRALVMEAFKVPAGSMMPTLTDGDHFFVDKMALRKRAAQRGELVVFEYPENPKQDFVKRAIATGGDKLEVRNGAVVINGWEVPRCEVGTWSYEERFDGTRHSGKLFVEWLDDAGYYVFLDDAPLASDYQGPYFVKPGETYVLGDNRNNSHDSRMWFGGVGGGVPRDHLKGVARMLWLSPTPGRAGSDLGTLGPLPSPELADGVKRCVAARPPRAKTSPPSSREADR